MKGLDPLKPWFMTTFLYLMKAREDGHRMTPEGISAETQIELPEVEVSLDILVHNRWAETHPDGYEITPDGGLAFYSLISGGLPPTPEELS